MKTGFMMSELLLMDPTGNISDLALIKSYWNNLKRISKRQSKTAPFKPPQLNIKKAPPGAFFII
jgi:hypothetical protein